MNTIKKILLSATAAFSICSAAVPAYYADADALAAEMYYINDYYVVNHDDVVTFNNSSYCDGAFGTSNASDYYHTWYNKGDEVYIKGAFHSDYFGITWGQTYDSHDNFTGYIDMSFVTKKSSYYVQTTSPATKPPAETKIVTSIVTVTVPVTVTVTEAATTSIETTTEKAASTSSEETQITAVMNTDSNSNGSSEGMMIPVLIIGGVVLLAAIVGGIVLVNMNLRKKIDKYIIANSPDNAVSAGSLSCPECNTLNSDDSVFCRKCGNKIK